MRQPMTLHIKMQTMLTDEKGATMVEYSLMVAFIAMVAVAAVEAFGAALNVKFMSFAGLFP